MLRSALNWLDLLQCAFIRSLMYTESVDISPWPIKSSLSTTAITFCNDSSSLSHGTFHRQKSKHINANRSTVTQIETYWRRSKHIYANRSTLKQVEAYQCRVKHITPTFLFNDKKMGWYADEGTWQPQRINREPIVISKFLTRCFRGAVERYELEVHWFDVSITWTEEGRNRWRCEGDRSIWIWYNLA